MHWLKIIKIFLSLVPLVLVVAAAGMWAGMGSNRSRYANIQSCIGGAVWSQILIPLGNILGTSVGEKLEISVYLFFEIAGIVLLIIPGLGLIVVEIVVATRSAENSQPQTATKTATKTRTTTKTLTATIQESNTHIKRTNNNRVDAIYVSIGLTMFFAGALKVVDLILIFIPGSNYH